MNNYLRSFWYDVYQLTSDNFETSVMIASIAVLCVGLICLRGSMIRR
jgi:hypothetical protein